MSNAHNLRVSIADLAAKKKSGQKWAMLTCYEQITAEIFDQAGIPVLLVGDSAGNNFLGFENTISVQDTIVVVPPYPYSIEDDPADVPFEDCWYARPQLFFNCHLRPSGARPPKNSSYKIGPDDLLFQLVFFSTFENLNLSIHGPI